MRAGEVTVTGTEAAQSLLAVKGQTADALTGGEIFSIKSGADVPGTDPEFTMKGRYMSQEGACRCLCLSTHGS